MNNSKVHHQDFPRDKKLTPPTSYFNHHYTTYIAAKFLFCNKNGTMSVQLNTIIHTIIIIFYIDTIICYAFHGNNIAGMLMEQFGHLVMTLYLTILT